jgi:hypothetical protein
MIAGIVAKWLVFEGKISANPKTSVLVTAAVTFVVDYGVRLFM